jgi:hypothetical protein
MVVVLEQDEFKLNRRCERSKAIQRCRSLDCFASLATTDGADFQYDALITADQFFADALLQHIVIGILSPGGRDEEHHHPIFDLPAVSCLSGDLGALLNPFGATVIRFIGAARGEAAVFRKLQRAGDRAAATAKLHLPAVRVHIQHDLVAAPLPVIRPIGGAAGVCVLSHKCHSSDQCQAVYNVLICHADHFLLETEKASEGSPALAHPVHYTMNRR